MQFGKFQYSQPASVVIVNGNRVPFKTWTVNLNGYGSADTFTIDLPFRILSHLQGNTDLANTPDTESQLLANPDIWCEVYSGYPSNPNSYNENDLTLLISGYMDSADFYLGTDGSTGEYVELQGRNQVAPFMDHSTTDKFPNLTSSAIIQYFAGLEGLQTQITPTYTLAGTYYTQDHVLMTSSYTEWDLMSYLAEREGFMLNVQGNTLYFGPRSNFLSGTPMAYTYNQNLKTLKLSRTPHASRDIKVDVYSWQGTKKTRIIGTASRTTGYIERIKGTSGRQGYYETYYYPGLTKEQATKMAENILNQLSITEITGELTTYGLDTINVYTPLMINGVGYGIDGMKFWPTKVTHSFDMKTPTYNLDITFSNLNLPTNPGLL